MRSLTHHPIPRPLYSRSWPHERRNMRSVWPVGAVWGCLGRQTSSPLTLNGHASRVNTTTYDYRSNATSIRQHGNITDEIFAEFDYNANGLLTSVRRFEKDEDTVNEIAESLYEYNSNNAVTSITHNNASGSQIVKHSYTYDETNNIVEYLNSIDGSTSYDYDFLGQLISADSENLTDESYTYDENGNRILANGESYTTGPNNELTSDGDYTYTYDAEGNRTSKTNSTNRELYTWDYRNRLTTVTQQEWDSVEQDWVTVQIVEYTYDYNNIWIRKILDSNGDGTADSTTIFIPENYQTTVQIDNGTTTHHYLWTPNQQDKLLADTTPNSTSWALTDHLGTIRDILAATSTHLIYDAFGNLTSGANPLLFGYTGKAFDTDTALQNNINRWYDAAIGRWLCTDPIGFEGNDTNLYRYVKNKVTFFNDPMGLEFPFYTDPSLQAMRGIKDEIQRRQDEIEHIRQLFMAWYAAELNNAAWLLELPKCPHKIRLHKGWFRDRIEIWSVIQYTAQDGSVTRVGRYVPMSSKEWHQEMRIASWYYHPGSTVCIRSVRSNEGPTSQCCYDCDGNLITSGPAAGTADSSNETFGKHRKQDVKPFDWAKILDNGEYGYYCKLYFSVRPAVY